MYWTETLYTTFVLCIYAINVNLCFAGYAIFAENYINGIICINPLCINLEAMYIARFTIETVELISTNYQLAAQ